MNGKFWTYYTNNLLKNLKSFSIFVIICTLLNICLSIIVATLRMDFSYMRSIVSIENVLGYILAYVIVLIYTLVRSYYSWRKK